MTTGPGPRPERKPQWPFLVGFALSSFGTGLVLPLTALYLSGVLDAGTGGVGLYFTLTAVAAFVSNPFAGRLADQWGPVRVVLPALAFQTAGALVLAGSTSLRQATVAAVLTGIGNGSFFAVLTPTAKLIFGQEALNRLFAREFMIANVCIAGAAIVAGLLVAAGGEPAYRLCFAANGLSYALLAVAIIVQMRRTPPAGRRTDLRVRPLAPWRPYTDARFFALPATQMCIIGFGAVQLEAVMPLVLHDTAGFSTRVVAMFLAANGLAVFALQTWVERIVDRVGEIGALQRAALVWVASLPVLYLGATIAGAAGVAVVLLYAALFALAETLVAPSMQPLVAKSAPEGSIGTYAASVSMAYSIGAAIGPAVGSAVFGQAGLGWYLVLLAVVLSAPVPLMAYHRRVMRQPNPTGAPA